VVVTTGLEFRQGQCHHSKAEREKLGAAHEHEDDSHVWQNVHNPKLMERLAAEAGVKLAPPLYTDALGQPGTTGDTYEKMVRHNVTTIVAALKP